MHDRGMSGDAEPAWDTAAASETVDNEVTWTEDGAMISDISEITIT